jgi:hypothetical protein
MVTGRLGNISCAAAAGARSTTTSVTKVRSMFVPPERAFARISTPQYKVTLRAPLRILRAFAGSGNRPEIIRSFLHPL